MIQQVNLSWLSRLKYTVSLVVVNINRHHGKQGGELNRNCNVSVPDPLFLPIQYQKSSLATQDYFVFLHFCIHAASWFLGIWIYLPVSGRIKEATSIGWWL